MSLPMSIVFSLRGRNYIQLDIIYDLYKNFLVQFAWQTIFFTRRTMIEWRPIEGFDSYSVSSEGDIRNDFNGYLLHRYILQHRDFPVVGLMRQGKQYKRSVARLVANAFLVPHKLETFDTAICLDGDRMNCRVNNLDWRPRWFAVMYNRQFIHPSRYHIDRKIREKETGLTFLDSFEVAKWYGVLEKDLVLSIINRTYVWPVYLFFEVVER